MAREQDPDGEEGPGPWREFWSSRSGSRQAGWASFRGVEGSKEMTPRGSYALGTAGALKPAPGVVREACGVVGEGGPAGPLAGCTGAGAHRSSLPSGCHLHSAHTCTHTQCAQLCTRMHTHRRARPHMCTQPHAHGRTRDHGRSGIEATMFWTDKGTSVRAGARHTREVGLAGDGPS